MLQTRPCFARTEPSATLPDTGTGNKNLVLSGALPLHPTSLRPSEAGAFPRLSAAAPLTHNPYSMGPELDHSQATPPRGSGQALKDPLGPRPNLLSLGVRDGTVFVADRTMPTPNTGHE